MANTSVLQKVINYMENYGKPAPGIAISAKGLTLATFVIASLTVLAFRFHVGFLCLLLLGEYKENYEYWKHQLKSKR